MKKQGRPLKFGVPTERVSVRLPLPEYDRLCREARTNRRDLADHIRHVLSPNIDRTPRPS